MGMLPIVKYEGELYFFDERLNELRPVHGFDVDHPEPYRLDSSGFEAAHFKSIIAQGTPFPVYDADKVIADSNRECAEEIARLGKEMKI